MTDNHSQPEPLISEMTKAEFASQVDSFRKRASQGDYSASIALGYLYFRGGDGVRKDYAEALFWFKKVKLQDDTTGFVATHLATMYYKGLGVAKNYQFAAKYFRSAALHGHGKSRVLFAVLQKKGNGTLRKPRAADVIFRNALRDSKLSVLMRLVAFLSLWP